MKNKLTPSQAITKFSQFLFLSFKSGDDNILWESAASCSYSFIFSFIPVVMIIFTILISFLKITPEILGIVIEFCKKLSDIGVKTIIYTDISKDGMLNGTNLEIYKKLSKVVNSDIIASGGITFLDEIKELNKNHIYGAIVGKAIYSGNLDLKEVLEISK